jgi:hypothetical protein
LRIGLVTNHPAVAVRRRAPGELDDETMAQIEALKLAHSLSETLLLVIDERGEVVCAIPLEVD